MRLRLLAFVGIALQLVACSASETTIENSHIDQQLSSAAYQESASSIENTASSVSPQSSETSSHRSSTNNELVRYVSPKSKTYTTDDWNSYSGIADHVASFSLDLPSSWTIEHSVINDEQANKIAEFMPDGIIELKTGQKCFDTPPASADEGGIKPLFQDSGTIGGKTFVRRTSMVYTGPPAGAWYANEYCISDKGKAFVIAFYQFDEPKEKSNATYEKIIASFSFD